MRKSLILILCICGIIRFFPISGQQIEVSDPRLELRGNTILISYDILNSTQSDEFSVELEVKDSNGNKIGADALAGDVGEAVSGGANKQIAWDLEVDKIEMDASIFVKVYVTAIQPEEPEVSLPKVEEAEEDDPQDQAIPKEGPGDPGAEEEINKAKLEDSARKPSSSARSAEGYSRTGLILQSVVFPGLGLSRYKGGAHWVRGVAGYGCLGGAIFMNRQAVNTYAGIIDLSIYDEKDELYKKSLKQDNVSEILAYATIGIWVTDLVWTIVGTSDMPGTASLNKRINIRSKVDPVSNTPLIAFTYNFK
jgi:hypothetical protein